MTGTAFKKASPLRFRPNGGGGIFMGTVIVLAALIGVVALVIRGMIKDKKNGKSLQCGGDCKHCGGHCG